MITIMLAKMIRRSGVARLGIIMIVSLLAVMMVAAMTPVRAATVDQLTDAQKNSSYGFFVWLSENAKTADEREDAKVAAQILSNTISDQYSAKVFNDGSISSAFSNVEYSELIKHTNIGAENDATSLDCLRESISFISLGNSYRAKEDLHALKVSSGLMAMGELCANYQDNESLAHTNTFFCLENLAYRQLGGTWRYGEFDGVSDDPYEGWYTEEKNNFDTNNGKVTGHYKTLTDRQGTMITTGFGIKHSYDEQMITASDGKEYPCTVHNKYYAQEFSDQSRMYPIGSGNTPEEYLAYIDQYECAVIGHDYKDVEGTSKEATCTEAGKEADQKCSRCGDEKEGAVIDALGHDYKTVAESAKDPTCTEDGKEADQKCSRCQDVIVGKTIDKLGHDYKVDESTAKDPTCTETGKKADQECSRCHDVITGETMKALEHDYKAVEGSAKEATCTEAGKKADQECSRCHDVITGETIKALEHDYKAVEGTAKEATCTVDGREADQKCSRCGEVKEGAVIPARHAFGTWEIIDPATYEATGLERRTCSVCGESEDRSIPVLEKKDLAKAVVSGISSKVYTGKPVKQKIVVKISGETIDPSNYTVSYSNNTNAGKASIIIKGKVACKGSITKTFTITKAAQKLTVKAGIKNLKAKKLKRKSLTVKGVFKVTNAKGTVKYKAVKFANKKAKKALKLNAKNGTIKVKNGTKKGKYKMTVAVTAKGNGNYKSATRKVTVTVKVK